MSWEAVVHGKVGLDRIFFRLFDIQQITLAYTFDNNHWLDISISLQTEHQGGPIVFYQIWQLVIGTDRWSATGMKHRQPASNPLLSFSFTPSFSLHAFTASNLHSPASTFYAWKGLKLILLLLMFNLFTYSFCLGIVGSVSCSLSWSWIYPLSILIRWIKEKHISGWDPGPDLSDNAAVTHTQSAGTLFTITLAMLTMPMMDVKAVSKEQTSGAAHDRSMLDIIHDCTLPTLHCTSYFHTGLKIGLSHPGYASVFCVNPT